MADLCAGDGGGRGAGWGGGSWEPANVIRSTTDTLDEIVRTVAPVNAFIKDWFMKSTAYCAFPKVLVGTNICWLITILNDVSVMPTLPNYS